MKIRYAAPDQRTTDKQSLNLGTRERGETRVTAASRVESTTEGGFRVLQREGSANQTRRPRRTRRLGSRPSDKPGYSNYRSLSDILTMSGSNGNGGTGGRGTPPLNLQAPFSRVETVRRLTPSPLQLLGEFNLPKMLERMSTPSIAGDGDEPNSASSPSQEPLVSGPSFPVDPKLNQPPDALYTPTAEKPPRERQKSSILEAYGTVQPIKPVDFNLPLQEDLKLLTYTLMHIVKTAYEAERGGKETRGLNLVGETDVDQLLMDLLIARL